MTIYAWIIGREVCTVSGSVVETYVDAMTGFRVRVGVVVCLAVGFSVWRRPLLRRFAGGAIVIGRGKSRGCGL